MNVNFEPFLSIKSCLKAKVANELSVSVSVFKTLKCKSSVSVRSALHHDVNFKKTMHLTETEGRDFQRCAYRTMCDAPQCAMHDAVRCAMLHDS